MPSEMWQWNSGCLPPRPSPLLNATDAPSSAITPLPVISSGDSVRSPKPEKRTSQCADKWSSQCSSTSDKHHALVTRAVNDVGGIEDRRAYHSLQM